MVEILKKQHTKLRVKQIDLPESKSPLLGAGIDVMTLPEGHMSCSKCSGYKWEAWVGLDNHRLEMGCLGCGHSCRLLFPLDIDLMAFGGSGRFVCKKHPSKGMVLIHNSGYLCVGCESCRTEATVQLRTESNLVVADA